MDVQNKSDNGVLGDIFSGTTSLGWSIPCSTTDPFNSHLAHADNPPQDEFV